MEGYDEGIKDPEDNRKRNVQVSKTNIIIILLLMNKNLCNRLNSWINDGKTDFLRLKSISGIIKYVDWIDWLLYCLFNRWTDWSATNFWLIDLLPDFLAKEIIVKLDWLTDKLIDIIIDRLIDWLIDWLIDLLRLLVWDISLVSLPPARRSTPLRTI